MLDPNTTNTSKVENNTNDPSKRDVGELGALSENAHRELLRRLTAKVRLAEEYGWRSCAIERPEAGARLNAWGVPPGDVVAYPIPDWSEY